MTEQLKYIVEELNNPPFNANYNLISFDALNPLQLLQVLSDALCTIEQKPKIDLREETSEDTAFRLLNTLRLIKYPPPPDANGATFTEFRQGLVEGDKHVIYSILAWLFPRFEELQKRLYLAKFLVRVEVPPEFLQDPEVEQMNNACHDVVEEFKAVHKSYSGLREQGSTTDDIRQDIQAMEQEQEQLQKRVEKLKKKVEHGNQKQQMLEVARNLRLEADREVKTAHLKQEQRNILVHAEQKCQRLQQQIKEMQSRIEHLNPEDVIKKLQEENSTNSYLVNEKLPKETDLLAKATSELQKVVELPMLDQADLQGLTEHMNGINNEINKLVEERNLQQDPTKDKLAVFRQQASMVVRKKEAAAESLQAAKAELVQIEEELATKKATMRDPEGNEIITQTQFKNYVNKLRTKTIPYKKKRQELQDLKAESGVLMRTEELLRQQAEKLGITVQDVDSEVEDPPLQRESSELLDKSTDELSTMVQSLSRQLEDRKSDLSPLVQEIRPLRDQHEELISIHEEKKRQYDALATSFQTGYASLEQEVNSLRQTVTTADSSTFKLTTEKSLLEAYIERANAEMESVTSGAKEGGRSKVKSFRDKLSSKIQESEQKGKQWREEQKSLSEAQQVGAKQMKVWRDTVKILEAKKHHLLQMHKIRNGPGSANQNTWQHSVGSRETSAVSSTGSHGRRGGPVAESMAL